MASSGTHLLKSFISATIKNVKEVVRDSISQGSTREIIESTMQCKFDKVHEKNPRIIISLVSVMTISDEGIYGVYQTVDDKIVYTVYWPSIDRKLTYRTMYRGGEQMLGTMPGPISQIVRDTEQQVTTKLRKVRENIIKCEYFYSLRFNEIKDILL